MEFPIVTLNLFFIPYTSRLLTIIPFSSSFFLNFLAEILHLSKLKFIDYNKSGISIGPEYQTVYAKFVPDTVTNMGKLVRKWEEDGTLKKLLEIKNNL